MKIGFIGLGIMGSRMAANLAHNGYELLIWNRTQSKASALMEKNQVTWKDHPTELAREAEVVITMLSSPDVVREMAAGEKGFLNDMKPDGIWMDSSTVNPAFSKEMAEEARERNIHFLDAPVAGSKDPAEKGELIFLAGGEKEDLKRVQPLLDVMGKKTIHVGENGKGTSLKIVFNLLLGQAMYAFSEGMSLGEALGIDQSDLFDVLLNSPVVAPFIAGKREKMAQEEFSPEFPLKWMQKDLQLAAETAFENGVFLPGVNTIKEIYALAKKAKYADQDFSSIYKFLKDA